MSKFDQAIDSLFTSKRGRKGRKVNLKDSLVCKEVYPDSPAARAGIRVGDHLAIVNALPAALWGALTWRWKVLDNYSYRFIDSSGEEILVESSLTELGVRYERTTPAIKKFYDPVRHIYQDLILLWERKEWSLLKRLSADQMHDFNGTNWLQRKLTQPKPCSSPATLLYGLALQELGQQDQGQNIIQIFADEYLHGWTVDVHAIYMHDLAKRAIARGNKQEAREISREGHEYYQFETTIAWHRKTFNEQPPRLSTEESRFENFPGHALPPLDDKGPLSLLDFAAGTQPGQWNLFICMASYRGNGPYNELMATFRRNQALIKKLFSPPIVITEEAQRRPDRDYWHYEEDKLKETSLFFRVMHDGKGLNHSLQVETTPDVFIVDRDLKILYRGSFDNHHLWKAMHQVLRRTG